jgi:hypothetical protein
MTVRFNDGDTWTFVEKDLSECSRLATIGFYATTEDGNKVFVIYSNVKLIKITQ